MQLTYFDYSVLDCIEIVSQNTISIIKLCIIKKGRIKKSLLLFSMIILNENMKCTDTIL